MKSLQEIKMYAWGFQPLSGYSGSILGKIKLCSRNLYRKIIHKHNFGDYLSYYLVSKLSGSHIRVVGSNETNKLLAIGTILSRIQNNDIVWGSGARSYENIPYRKNVKFFAIRGPLTCQALLSRGLIEKSHADKIPFFDPAILLKIVHPELTFPKEKSFTHKSKTVIIPHYSELRSIRDLGTSNFIPKNIQVLNPFWHPLKLAQNIAVSDRVISSSLHGLIVAESLGVEAIPFRTAMNTEFSFKYEDYYEGTGRITPKFLNDVKYCFECPAPKMPVYDETTLMRYINSFPFSLKSNYKEMPKTVS
jgi:pyruvyltransferase